MRNYVRLGLFGIVATSATLAFIACGSDDDDTTPTKVTDGGHQSDAPVTTSTGTPDSGCPAVAEAACGNVSCTKSMGAPATCVSGTCQKLEGISTCAAVGGVTNDDNAFIFGVMLPQTGDNAMAVVPIDDALQLAVNEVNAAGGVPTGTSACAPKRPLGYVICDDGDVDPDSGTSATANFLSTTLKVPLVVGSYASGHTLPLAKDLIANKVMMFSPASTSPLLTDPSKNTDPTQTFNASPDGVRLFWRTAISDAAGSVVIHAIENEVAAGDMGKTKLAMLNKADAYGEGLVPGILNGLQVNGAAPVPWTADVDGGTDPDGGNATGNFYQHQFNVVIGEEVTDADGGTSAGPELGQIIADLAAFQPTAIIVLGTDESVNIINAYEAYLVAHPSQPKPQWVLSDGLRVGGVFTTAMTYPTFAARARGDVSGVPSQLQTEFDNDFSKAYAGQDPSSYGATLAYDIGYSVAYALASTQGKTVTGDILAGGMANLVGGPTAIDFSPANLATGFSVLVSGGKIDINGTSGPLQYNQATGEATSDYSVWCVVPTTGGAYGFNDTTGETYSAKTGMLSGTFSCPQ